MQQRTRHLPVQFRLRLEQSPSFRREDFIVSDCNAQAVEAIDAWPAWRDGALVLVGPPGSGKTHLARAWAERAGALELPPNVDLAGAVAHIDTPVLIEDADRRAHGEALFHLLNKTARSGHGLLLTARTPPSEWRAEVPDLRSRLNALAVAELSEPDDAVLTGVLAKFFRERNLKPSEDLLPYLVRRIERSVPKAQEIVDKLDEAADVEQRPVSRALARQILDDTESELSD